MENMLTLPYYKEEWRDIAGYEGKYQISSFGRVKRLNHYVHHSKNFIKELRTIIMKQSETKFGYKYITFYDGKHFFIHRLVGEAFIPNPENNPQIDHIDRNPANNWVVNLRWVDSITQNNNRDLTNCITKQSKPVIQLNLDGSLVKKWCSINEVGRNGFSVSKVCLCCQGKRNKHKGFIWRYVT